MKVEKLFYEENESYFTLQVDLISVLILQQSLVYKDVQDYLSRFRLFCDHVDQFSHQTFLINQDSIIEKPWELF